MRESRLSQIEAFLRKSERFIQSAQLLADAGDMDSAASRLYYAMFFIAEALLEKQGHEYSSHRAVISAFGQQFSKTQTIDPRFHQALLAGFSQRQLGDYAVHSGLVKEDIEKMMEDADDFLSAARAWLKKS